MTTELTITILAEDILTTNYYNSNKCAITRALRRTGRFDLRDSGTLDKGDETLACIKTNESYHSLVHKVLSMYYSSPNWESKASHNTLTGINGELEIKPIKIEDFEHILIFEE